MISSQQCGFWWWIQLKNVDLKLIWSWLKLKFQPKLFQSIKLTTFAFGDRGFQDLLAYPFLKLCYFSVEFFLSILWISQRNLSIIQSISCQLYINKIFSFTCWSAWWRERSTGLWHWNYKCHIKGNQQS